jgi:hypothetical protein
MVTDRPTASLTGQEDWEWNRRRREQQPSESSTAGTDRGARERDAPAPREHGTDREAALRREIRDLEAELERTERRLQGTIDRYERLLADKNRKLNDREDADPDDTGYHPTSLATRWFPISPDLLWWRTD